MTEDGMFERWLRADQDEQALNVACGLAFDAGREIEAARMRLARARWLACSALDFESGLPFRSPLPDWARTFLRGIEVVTRRAE